MIQSNTRRPELRYWLKVFALYVLTEACIQLLFWIVLNNFGTRPISLLEIHVLMWLFQCLLIAPIWWVAWSVRHTRIITQVIVNLAFYILYSYFWFGPVQDLVGEWYNSLIQVTRNPEARIPAILDSGDEYSYLNYQLLKHAFRLSWFYLAAYFYNYRKEEQKRLQLAVANRELQLKMLKWHLNPAFYFKTIDHLQKIARNNPGDTTAPILQLAKVMEYVIYEAKEKWVDVKKEIQFLHHYTALLNQQQQTPRFSTTVSGDPGTLKISPLLLAGLVDRVANEQPHLEHTIHLSFSGNTLLSRITARKSSDVAYSIDEEMKTRLAELYPGRSTITATGQSLALTLQLGEGLH